MDLTSTALASRDREKLRDYAEVLNPQRLAEYLGSINWARLADKPFGQLWATADRTPGELSSVILPKDGAGDFDARWPEAIGSLARVLDRSIAELAEEVASVRADLLFVRVDQASSDSTIPLAQATALLESIQKMVRTAAAVTYNPERTGGGRVSGTVRDFLDDDVRMGHTKRGSFIITVAARHDDAVFALKANGMKPRGGQPEPEVAFSRRVMTTLSRSLDATKHHLSDGPDYVNLENAVKAGVRAPLVEALHEIGSREGLRQVDLTFNWSHALQAPPHAVSEVAFSPEEFEELPEVRDRLKREYEPQLETVVGRITSLKRPDHHEDDRDEGGQVIMRGVVGDRDRNLQLDLGPKQYDMAIAAHRGRYPLVAKGTIHKVGRRWTMQRDVQLSRLDIDEI